MIMSCNSLAFVMITPIDRQSVLIPNTWDQSLFPILCTIHLLFVF